MRNFIISQLTQMTTWLGLLFILAGVFLPHAWIIVLGLLIVVTDDKRFQRFFDTMRQALEEVWKP